MWVYELDNAERAAGAGSFRRATSPGSQGRLPAGEMCSSSGRCAARTELSVRRACCLDVADDERRRRRAPLHARGRAGARGRRRARPAAPPRLLAAIAEARTARHGGADGCDVATATTFAMRQLDMAVGEGAGGRVAGAPRRARAGARALRALRRRLRQRRGTRRRARPRGVVGALATALTAVRAAAQGRASPLGGEREQHRCRAVGSWAARHLLKAGTRAGRGV